jgi:signal transduction histidine kinase
VEAAVRAMEYPISQHGFHLGVHIEGDLPLIRADRDAIEQAVLNLLSNAVKFSGDSREIELQVSREKEEVVIRVTDHGIGIASEEHRRIFDKFYRVATRGNQLIPGTGLGLTLVSQIAAAHDGAITLDSAPGKGSTFRLRLPIRPKIPPQQGETT